MKKVLSLLIAMAVVSPVFAQAPGPGGTGASSNQEMKKMKKKRKKKLANPTPSDKADTGNESPSKP